MQVQRLRQEDRFHSQKYALYLNLRRLLSFATLCTDSLHLQ